MNTVPVALLHVIIMMETGPFKLQKRLKTKIKAYLQSIKISCNSYRF